MYRRLKWLIVSIGLLLLLNGILYGADRYNRNLDIPRLYIHGKISKMVEKTDVERVQVEYRDKDQQFTAYAKLKVQGASSLYLKKKNYNIKFYDSAYENRRNVDLGWGEQSKYCMKANWIDFTHTRNLVSAQLAAEMQRKYGLMDQAPRNGLIEGYPMEVYANGKFLGLYTMNMPKDAWTYGMDETNENHLLFCGITWEPAGMFEAMPDYGSWELKVGEPNEANIAKLQRVFDFVLNSTDEEFRAQFEDYLNLDATMNYIIMCALAEMPDNVGKNMLLATYDGVHWYPTLYDLDTTWGADWEGKNLYDYTDLSYMEWNKLFRRVRDSFGPELARHYFELREEILTREHIMERFNAFEARIPSQSFYREKLRWGTPPGFGLDQIEEFLDIRLPLIDDYMGALQG